MSLHSSVIFLNARQKKVRGAKANRQLLFFFNNALAFRVPQNKIFQCVKTATISARRKRDSTECSRSETTATTSVKHQSYNPTVFGWTDESRVDDSAVGDRCLRVGELCVLIHRLVSHRVRVERLLRTVVVFVVDFVYNVLNHLVDEHVLALESTKTRTSASVSSKRQNLRLANVFNLI